MENYANFSEFLKERIKEQNLNLKKLSELTRITVRNLENLTSSRFENLPPAPYLRGYLKKLGEVLNFDDESWWQALKEKRLVKTSGEKDILPYNRFAFRKDGKKIILLSVLAVFALYLIFRYFQISGKPILDVQSPSQDFSTTSESVYLLSGSIQNADQLLINQEAVKIDSSGHWEKNFNLSPGLNAIEFRAKKFLGSDTVIMKTINFENVNSLDNQTPNQY